MKPFDFDSEGLKPRKLISSASLQRRIGELAAQMARSYKGKPLVVLGLMNGSLFFLVDLLRKVPADWEVECWRVQSYRGFHPGAKLHGLASCRGNFKGRHVLVVDDILDTGQTLSQVVAHVRKLGAKSVDVCVLLNKRKKRRRPVKARWIGFPISNEFVVGYGLDLDGRFRALRDIWVIEEVSKT